jgi:type I restriction enzyme R subunit
MSNFTYLKTNWPDLYATTREAEQNVNSAPRTSCFYTRRSLEIAVKWLYANDSYLKKPYADNLTALIHEPTFRENLEFIQPYNSIAKRHNAIYSAHYTQ